MKLSYFVNDVSYSSISVYIRDRRKVSAIFYMQRENQFITSIIPDFRHLKPFEATHHTDQKLKHNKTAPVNTSAKLLWMLRNRYAMEECYKDKAISEEDCLRFLFNSDYFWL